MYNQQIKSTDMHEFVNLKIVVDRMENPSFCI